MRKIEFSHILFLAFLSVISIFNVTAQELKTKAKPEQFFLNFGSGGGTGGTMGAGFSILPAKNKGIHFGYRFITHDASNKPDDYHAGLCIFGNCQPQDYFHLATVAYKMMFNTRKERIKYGFEAGPSLVFNNKAYFTPQTAGWFGSNYQINRRIETTVGLNLRGVVDFNLLKRFGLEIAGFTNLNPESFIGGAELCLLLGKIR